MKEYALQKAIVSYIKLQYPNVLYCASAGGMRTSISVAKRMKYSGYVKGFPDLAIFEINKYNGLFLEIKTEKGRPTKEQLWWRDELNKRNYVAEIVYGYVEATELIDKYIQKKIK